MQSNPVFLFLLKAMLVYVVLSLPLGIYDKVYGNFFRKINNATFGTFHKNGFAWFREGTTKQMTEITIGNRNSANASHQTQANRSETNTRYRGYIPLILFIALLLATRINRRRKLTGLFAGFLLLTGMTLLKEWFEILYICQQNPWLKLYDFSRGESRMIIFIQESFVSYPGPALFLVVVIWMVVAFRKADVVSLID